jgi:hypothetical protein
MKKTIFYTGPFDNGLRPHKFLRMLSEFYYNKKMTSDCGKVFNLDFIKNKATEEEK